MSTSVTLRIPDDILEKLDCIKGKRSEVIIQILSASLHRGSGVLVPDAEVQAKMVADNAVAQQKRELHDPATCRIYKCGMCAIVKA